MAEFEHRGVVEGFYGPPWSHADRLWMIERLGRWGLNRYVYAPKDDPLHRSEWRTPYPAERMREFAELVEAGARAGVAVGFAVAPGLSISYASSADRRALIRKLETFRKLGARFLSLALDDVPTRLVHEPDRRAFDSLGHAHVALAGDVREALGADATLWIVPTDYLGVGPTDYLETLGAGLTADVEVGWTGRTVVSPTVELEEAAVRAATLRRRLLIWDNVPVNDGPMRGVLHLGPYGGRTPGLAEHASGVLLNPMPEARASAVAIRTAAEYLSDPGGYDPEAAWTRALDEIGAGEREAFGVFAQAHRFSPTWPDARDAALEASLERLVARLEAGEDLAPELGALRGLLEARLEAPGRLRERMRDRALTRELEPWLASHERETRRMAAATEAAATLLGDGSGSARTRAFMGLEGRLARDPETGKSSYGPRRVLYPQLASLRDDEMGLGDDAALFRDCCLADELVELVEDLAVWLLTPGELS